MARQRIISAAPASDVEDVANQSLRPQRMGDYVGQASLIEKLSIALTAAKQRGEAMEHVLLHGPPGLGKTTLSHVIANEMGTHLTVTAGPALTKGSDLVGTLTKLQKHDVLFIDEIHRLPVALEEYLYSAMEDFKVEFVVDSGMHAKTITLPLQPFSLIGATTRAGLLSGPMRSRFGITHHLEFYTEPELLNILRRSAGLLGVGHAEDDALALIAARSRGTPRVANRLLRRVRDFAQIKTGGVMNAQTVNDALKLEGVDALGLDELDRSYLQTIAEVYRGGPVGLEAVAATLNEDSGTLEDMVEPYLLQLGFLARTRRGRQLTRKAADHLGINITLDDANNDLFTGES
ncbi:Holliday junction branch migration DNA helicase RuvB [Planctomycetales bacterium ZRK34]|nr:Holliday junction branch migration DNA helicase RuvB [Planctomycetales bacterium ZRK34]